MMKELIRMIESFHLKKLVQNCTFSFFFDGTKLYILNILYEFLDIIYLEVMDLKIHTQTHYFL